MTLRCLTAGVRVDLLGIEGEVRELVRRVAGCLIVDDGDVAAVSVGIGHVNLPAGADTEQAAARWVHALHVAALAHTSALPIHAAAVAGPAGCVVLPGPSGAGKSTLAAAAMQSGLTLLSDEAACFTTPVGTVLPHARPLKLSLLSRQLLGVSGLGDRDEEIAVPPEVFGDAAAPTSSHRCLGIVLPLRETGRLAVLEPISRSAALSAMSRSRLLADAGIWTPESAWVHLSELVGQVHVAALHYDDPHEAAAVLERLLR